MKRRVFLGLPVPHQIQKSLSVYCDSIANDSLRFTKPENYHITVSFFGEQDESSIPLVTDEISRLIENTHPFSIQFEGISFAPPKKNPSMIWAQYRRNSQFTDLVRTVERSLSSIIRFSDKRDGQEPIPHITLARFKQPQSFTLPQIELDMFSVTYAVLFESKRTEGGILYETLMEFHLANM